MLNRLGKGVYAPNRTAIRFHNVHSRLRCRLNAAGEPASTTAAATAAVDYLIMNIDGFNAQKAVAACPTLPNLQIDSYVMANLAVIQSLIPTRIQGQLFTNHPQLLETDMEAWVDFLTSFGFQDTQIADTLRASPEVFYQSNVFQAGQLLLFLRQNLQLPEDVVVQQCFKWAAVLSTDATQASMAAVVQQLQQQLGLSDKALLAALQTFPGVLGWDVERDLLPKLAFFQSLGPEGQRLDTMWNKETGFLQGLRSWSYSVAPKLQLLQDLLGSEEEAQAVIRSCPSVLKLPVETKLQPVLSCLATVGLSGDQLTQLLKSCPKLLAEPKECVVSRINFLYDVIGSGVEELMQYPQYALLSLADTIGPRYYFLARQAWLNDFSDASTGILQLQRVMQPALNTFLADVAQVTGEDVGTVAAEYQELKTEWDNLLGWCCDKAFSSLNSDEISSMYQEQLNLFYVLVQ